MRIKTFYAKTMAEALREIKGTLGPEALLLSTKEVPRRSGVLGRSSGFEVVAASDHSEDMDFFSPGSPAGTVEKNIPLPKPGSANAISDGFAAGMYAPARMVSGYSAIAAGTEAMLGLTEPNAENPVSAEDLPETPFPFKGRVSLALYQDLVDCGVESELARELLLQALDRLPIGQRRSRQALLRSVSEAARTRLAAPSHQDGIPEKKVVAFIGPTGVGKTISIAKLAARLALQKKKKVVLVTQDGFRIGAIEQLRSYAGLMGIPFRFADQVADLKRVIEENSQRDYILIDTAGQSPRDMESIRSLATFLTQSDTIERHLVLSASTKPSDMRTAMDRFEVCAPDHLLFTKLDETSTPGPMLNELVRTQKRFSYYTDGPRVPDDLHTVPGEHIIDLVLNRNEYTAKE